MASQLPVAKLKSGKSRFVECGHPWIFSGAIDKDDESEEDVRRVVNARGDQLGFALRSPRSDIRLRMCAFADENGLEIDQLRAGIRSAMKVRQTLGLPDARTTVYRLLNSEGDGLPGLIIDIFEKIAVVQLTTKPMHDRRDRIAAALTAEMPELEGIVAAPAPQYIAQKEGFEPDVTPIAGVPGATSDVVEHGVRFEIDWNDFQKTGHYTDMREHRRWIAEHARGKRVLDAFSYTGGFGLASAALGATQVVCVDSSRHAIDRVARNAQNNDFSNVEGVVSRVDDYLRSAYDRGLKFDIVVLDPPKLAPSRKHQKKALKVYESLVIQASRLVPDSGVIAVGSCSQAIGRAELERTLGSARARDGRDFRVVRCGVQASDHPYPAAMEEALYLTFVAAVVG